MVTCHRKPWVGGNWKCNGTKDSIATLVSLLNKVEFDKEAIDVVVFPSPVHLLVTRNLLNTRFEIGAQNISKTGNGAYTGETSIEMLKDADSSWTLIGHSERRQYYGETDTDVEQKLERCQQLGIRAAVCIGEDLQQRNDGNMKTVLSVQLNAILPKLTDWSRVVIAYEPVWAIGTGVVATPQQVREAHAFIRDFIKGAVGPEASHYVRIVYGGSVNASNCKVLAELEDVDGFLVGGASLKPEFADIIMSEL